MDTQPDTHDVDQSEIRTQILLATASSALRGRHSFTHMLTEVRQLRSNLTSRTDLQEIPKNFNCCDNFIPFFLYSCLSFRESKADVEAPVFLMESAVVSAHSKCLNKSRWNQKKRLKSFRNMPNFLGIYLCDNCLNS